MTTDSTSSSVPRHLLAGVLALCLVLAACGPDGSATPETEVQAEPGVPVAPTETTEEVLDDAAEEAAEEPNDDSGRAPTEATEESAQRAGEPRAWPHESSDIPVDERIHFGHLENGMRWAWADNPEPKERVYVRLHVDVGSLAEEDDELGMAHFLEHMAFNGSRNFPPGHLIVWFQQHGMSFGADTNAHTAFSETVYKLDLPKNDRKSIVEGLTVLRDFADGMTIAEEDVQGEKGVIDGEQRERDSAQMRVMMGLLDLGFAGTRIGERLPIGTKEVRDQFTAESVRAFYERWYRPELMTLVIVGDLGDLDPEALIEESFADMPVPERTLEFEPGPGKPDRLDHFYAIHEPEIPSVRISISKLSHWEPEPVTVETWVEDIPLDYAYSMLNLRYAELAKKPETAFLSASGSNGNVFDVYESEGVSIQSTPEKWKEALAQGEQELRRALRYGFQEAELEELRADALRSLDEAVEREKTADSRRLLNRILSAAESPTVPTDAETRRKILKPVIEGLTVEACHEALVAAWAEGELSVTTTGALDLGDDAEKELRAAYEAAAKVEVQPREEQVTSDFAYASKASDAGKVAERKHVEDLDFHTVRFENGVLLNVKRTDFKERSIGMSVEFGEGQRALPPEQHQVMGQLAPAVINGSGLEAHTVEELRRLTAGKQVGVGFGVGGDRFTLGGATTPDDLLMQCELAAAYLKAPGFREEALVPLRNQIPMLYMQLAHMPQGPLQTEFMPKLMGGDVRFAWPSQEQLTSVTAEQVRDLMLPLIEGAPVEVTLVGDLDVDEAVAAVARTFGALPERRARKSYDREPVPAPAASLRETYPIQTQIQKSLVLMVFPTTDGIDIERRRKLNLLNEVVMDRLRVHVRERLGAAYSPGSAAQTSTTNPGVGMQIIQAMADPEKVDKLVEACQDVAKSLAADGVTDEELERLLEPIVNRRRDAKRTNGWWLSGIARAQTEPEQLDILRSGDAFYSSVAASDITPMAKKYLLPERASIAVVNPE